MAKSKYESHVLPKLELIRGWARDGLTDQQIAANLNIAYSTFNDYKAKHSEISEALKESKELADYQVENALYKSALDGNTTAQIFWLKNRKPKQWRDRPEGGKDAESKLSEALERMAEAYAHEPSGNR